MERLGSCLHNWNVLSSLSLESPHGRCHCAPAMTKPLQRPELASQDALGEKDSTYCRRSQGNHTSPGGMALQTMGKLMGSQGRGKDAATYLSLFCVPFPSRYLFLKQLWGKKEGFFRCFKHLQDIARAIGICGHLNKTSRRRMRWTNSIKLWMPWLPWHDGL